MKILVVNAGSSSLKYQLFDMATNTVLAKGNCERIGIDGVITHKCPGKPDYKAEAKFENHRDAIKLVLSLLTDSEKGVIASVDEIMAVGHRVVHGGEKIKQSTILTDEEIKYLESIVELNPLHGPPAILGFKACKEVMPNIKHVGVFDTSYYSSMEEDAYIYPIPYELYEEFKIRKYGFHGTSHRYVAGIASDLLGNKNAKIITCHLGNGSSITATMNGKAIDTSMGFTPNDGVPMGTRCGAIDPTVVTYIQKAKGLTAEEADKLINSKSGLSGVSGVSSDCRDIRSAAKEGNARAQLALDLLRHNIRKIIGAYVAEMNGVDAIVFTAGIGENDRALRQEVATNLEFLGVDFDIEANNTIPSGTAGEISKKDSKVKVFVIPTNEEYMIALDTFNLANKIMKKYIFEKGKWNENEMFYAYSPACADRATFRQEEGAIVNGKGNSFFGYEMIPMFETKKRSKGMLAQADCLFESFGAPLIVITNDITKDKSGYFVYGQYFEVVAYEKGINIWFVKPNKEGAECPIDPTLLATKEFTILPNTRIDIKMQIEGNLIKGWVNGEYLEAKADNLPDEFYVGITACEGINRFYSFTVQD